jgi:hypothetical protein
VPDVDPEEQLSGVRALMDGPCTHPACKLDGQILKDQRVVKHKDGGAHVVDMPGWDEPQPAKKPRKRAAKKTTPPNPPIETSGAEPDEAGPSGPSAPALDRALEDDEWWAQTTPGLVSGMPNDVYHRDPWVGGSISNSDAQLLLDAPALFKYRKEHPRKASRQQNLGSAAHTKVLGAGDELVKLDAGDYRSPATRAKRDEALAAGKIPLLGQATNGGPSEWDRVEAMARKLEEDPLAPMLFTRGEAEVSAFWTDPETGVARRARFDWLPEKVEGVRLIVPDFKSTEHALSPEAFARSAADYGYAMQDYTYSSALAALDIDVDAAFLFVVQSTLPPYLVAIHQLDQEAREFGHQRTVRALRRYQYATETGDWFGWEGQVHDVDLPPWVYKNEGRDAERDHTRYLTRGWKP